MRAANRWSDVLAGSAETIPLQDASIDAVFVAEAFHWFCDSPALQEIERVLRPRGTLALLWNRPRESIEELIGVHELMEELRALAGVSAKTHRFYSGEFRQVFEGSAFAPLREAAFEHDQRLDKHELVSYFMSQSTAASRTPAERAEIRAARRLIPAGRHVRPLTTGSIGRSSPRAGVRTARLPRRAPCRDSQRCARGRRRGVNPSPGERHACLGQDRSTVTPSGRQPREERPLGARARQRGDGAVS